MECEETSEKKKHTPRKVKCDYESKEELMKRKS